MGDRSTTYVVIRDRYTHTHPALKANCKSIVQIVKYRPKAI